MTTSFFILHNSTKYGAQTVDNYVYNFIENEICQIP